MERTEDGKPASRLPTPGEILAWLDRRVEGQESAKRVLANAAYQHYLGVALRARARARGRLPFGVQHALLVGPSGSGKTLSVESVARLLGVPYLYVDCTTLAQTGYVGVHPDDVVRRLLAAAGGDAERAGSGIVFLDEVDKIRRSDGAYGPDVSGAGAQLGLLTLLDGALVPCSTRPGDSSEVVVDTSGIWFVLAGAFVGLEEIVRRRRAARTPRAPSEEEAPRAASRSGGSSLAGLTEDDLVAFGLLPELVGRLPHVAVLEPLSEENLANILAGSERSPLRQKMEFFSVHGIRVEVTPGALRAMARRARMLGTGARALRNVVEQVFGGSVARIGELVEGGVRRLRITPDVVLGLAEPEVWVPPRGEAVTPDGRDDAESLREEALRFRTEGGCEDRRGKRRGRRKSRKQGGGKGDLSTDEISTRGPDESDWREFEELMARRRRARARGEEPDEEGGDAGAESSDPLGDESLRRFLDDLLSGKERDDALGEEGSVDDADSQQTDGETGPGRGGGSDEPPSDPAR